jgi:hypothetical protein
MNKKRLLFGVLSSLLLAVGFARAAERFDPVSREIENRLDAPAPDGTTGGELRATGDCNWNCDALFER